MRKGLFSMTKTDVRNLIESSKQVIRDCALENGSLVAANCAKDYFPRSQILYLCLA